MPQDLNYIKTWQQIGRVTYKCNASNDFIENRGDDGSLRWTSISFLFSTNPLRIIFCRSDLSAGETGASSVVLSSGKSPAPTAAFGLPLRTGWSFVVRLILSTCYHKKKIRKCTKCCVVATQLWPEIFKVCCDIIYISTRFTEATEWPYT
jgi:hypothetical protein